MSRAQCKKYCRPTSPAKPLTRTSAFAAGSASCSAVSAAPLSRCGTASSTAVMSATDMWLRERRM